MHFSSPHACCMSLSHTRPLIIIVKYGCHYCTFDGLGPLYCSNSEWTSETMNPFRYFGRTPWTGDGPLQDLYLHRTAQHRKMRANMHASIGIRTHDPSVRTVQDHRHLRPYDHWDWLMIFAEECWLWLS
jgi:hypothetical protein